VRGSGQCLEGPRANEFKKETWKAKEAVGRDLGLRTTALCFCIPWVVPNVQLDIKREVSLTRNAEIFILVSFIVFGNSVLVYKT
jgi:hypothetical protein